MRRRGADGFEALRRVARSGLVLTALLAGGGCLNLSELYPPGPCRAELDAPLVEVPIRYDQWDLPHVQVYVGKAGPFDFVLETSTAVLVMDRRSAESLPGERLVVPAALEVEDGDAVSGSGPTEIDAEFLYIDELAIGGARFRDAGLLLVDFPPGSPDDFAMDGILGTGALRECIVTIDGPRERLSLREGSLPEPDGREILAWVDEQGLSATCDGVDDVWSRWSGELPRIPAMLCGQSISMCPSTTCSTWLALPDSFAESLPIRLEDAPPDGIEELSASDGGSPRWGRVDGDLRIGAVTVQQPIVVLRGEEAVLGARLLRHLAISMDYRTCRARVRVDPAPIGPLHPGWAMQ